MNIKKEKKYGLIVPQKSQLAAPKAINVFGDDEGSDEEQGTNWVNKTLQAEGQKQMKKKQTQLNMKKALEENPTIYQYDEVYEEMERVKEEEKKLTKKVDKKPKYINNLLKAAERRKREHEHRMERMIQKEREAEGEEFKDKESFITSAYRAKLEEMKKMEEEEKRMDRLESIADVTKQPDISGFYRHLYEQTIDKPENFRDGQEETKTTEPEKSGSIDRDDPISSGASEDENEGKEPKIGDSSRQNAKKSRQRQYRQRAVKESESEDEQVESKEEQTSKSEGDIEREQEGSSKDNKEQKKLDTQKSEEPEKKRQKLESTKTDKNRDGSPKKDEISTKEPEKKEDKENIKEPEPPKKKEPVKKVSIWEKRTIGAVFDAALERYYARKAMRLSGS